MLEWLIVCKIHSCFATWVKLAACISNLNKLMRSTTYTLGQRWVAYILLVSFFLESCYNPAVSKGALPLPLPVELIKKRDAIPLHQSQMKSKITYLGNPISAVDIEEVNIQKSPVSNQAVQPNIASNAQKKSFDTKSVIPIEKAHENLALNTTIKLHHQNQLAKNQHISRINTSTPSVKEACQHPLLSRFFTTRSGHRVVFQQLATGKWQATVEEAPLPGIKRILCLPVLLELGQSILALSEHSQAWQKDHIHVVLNKLDKSQSVVYIGKLGLAGGMMEEGDSSDEEDEEEGREEEKGNSLEFEDANDGLSSRLEKLWATSNNPTKTKALANNSNFELSQASNRPQEILVEKKDSENKQVSEKETKTRVSLQEDSFLKWDLKKEINFGQRAKTPMRSHGPAIIGVSIGGMKDGKSGKSTASDTHAGNNAFNQYNNARYLYQGTDIRAIGNHLIMSLNDPSIVYVGDIGRGHRETDVVGILSKNQEELTKNKSLVGIYNTGNNHWIAFRVYTSQGKITALYKDSLGQKCINLEKDINELFGQGAIFKNYSTREQKLEFEPYDSEIEQHMHTNCGVLALKNMMCLAILKVGALAENGAKSEKVDLEFFNPGDTQKDYQTNILKARKEFASIYARETFEQTKSELKTAALRKVTKELHQPEVEWLYKNLAKDGCKIEIETEDGIHSSEDYHYRIDCEKKDLDNLKASLAKLVKGAITETPKQGGFILKLSPIQLIPSSVLAHLKANCTKICTIEQFNDVDPESLKKEFIQALNIQGLVDKTLLDEVEKQTGIEIPIAKKNKSSQRSDSNSSSEKIFIGKNGSNPIKEAQGVELIKQEAKKKNTKKDIKKHTDSGKSNDSHHPQEGKQHLKQEFPLQQNEVPTTHSMNLKSLIFDTNDLTNFITAAISQITLFNDLYELRAEKIKTIIGKNSNQLCHKNEIKIIHSIIELLQQLLTQLNDKDTQQLKSTCEQILRLVHKYILYRVNGIQAHLNTGNVDKMYRKNANDPLVIYYSPDWGEIYINCTFEEHKAGRLREINAYHQKPEFNSTLQTLHRLVPALFYQQQSIDEFLGESKNPFSDQGVKFVEPPFLVKLTELVKCVELVYTHKHTAETLKNLNYISQKFTAKKDSSHILELLAKVYTPLECLAFWPQPSQMSQIKQQEAERFLHLCLFIGTYLPNIISYDLLEISKEKVKQAKKTLEKANSTLADKVEAGRMLLYSQIPWYLIRNISGLLSRSLNSEESKEKQTILEATKTLRTSWQSLLPALQELMSLEVSVITEQVDINPNQYQSLDESQYLPLTHLGNYAGDVLFLTKIKTTLSDLNFKKPFLPESYLRLVGILGECAKELSPNIKKLIGKDYWEELAKIRDRTAHTTGYLRRLQKVLEQKTELAEALKNELQLLLSQVQSVQNQLPSTWPGIQQFYGQTLDVIQPLPSNLGTELSNLQEALNPILTEEDYKELRSTKHFIPTGLEEKRDHILKIIHQKIEATSITQNAFFDLVDGLYLISTSQKDKIKEAYKKLRKGKEANLSPIIMEDLTKVKSVPDKEKDSCIELLIKNLKSYDKASVLEKELAKNGLLAAKDTWEEKRKKFFTKVNNKLPKPKSLSNQVWNFDKVLRDSIDAAKNILRLLEALERLVHSKDTSAMLTLEQFWNDPILCLAVEFHFTRLRIYTDVIQEALGYLPCYDVVHETILTLNNLYNSLAIKLKNIRLYGNSLAHLHDVTQFDGRTIHGHRFTAYHELWTALKDYKAFDSIKTTITQFEKILTKGVETINKNRTARLQDNRKTYQTVYRWQQQALAKLPNLSLSDYQILNNLSKIDDSDSHKLIKQQLYTATRKLLELDQEFLRLQNASLISRSAKHPSNATKYADVVGQKVFFQEIPIDGDGWCTLNAIGITDPTGAINLIKNQLNDLRIIRYIRRAIETNYQASLALGKEFDIVGNDNDNNNIKNKITALYLNCQNNDPTGYVEMLGYLERTEVQIAYLDYLSKTRYVDSNIAAVCLLLQAKKLAFFIDYNLPDGQLINSIEDNVSPTDPTTVCLVFHPNSTYSSAQYNLLNIKQK